MTSQSDRIQALVEQINIILHDASTDGESMVDEYQVLEQTRQRLTQLQQEPSLLPMASNSMASNPMAANEMAANETTIAVQDWATPAPVLAESAQQVLQAIVQEMAYLRMNTVQPLREEIVRLQQERNYLASEVQQLQHQRYQLVLAQQTDQQQMINGFLHALMERLQEQLTLQVAQTIAKLEGRSGTTLVSDGDAQVMQLDSTLQVVFDSLQANINHNQAALEQSLQKMQGLGQQGEAMFAAFVNRLASRLGQEASQHLQPSPSAASVESSILGEEMAVPSDDTSAGVNSAMDDSDLVSNSDSQRAANDLKRSSSQPIQAMSTDEAAATPIPEAIATPTQDFATVLPLERADESVSAVSDSPSDPLESSSVDQVIDQVIDNLENDAIAPLEALEAVDNLDLGFGLDAVELADVPDDQSELSALLQEPELGADIFADISGQGIADPGITDPAIADPGITDPGDVEDQSADDALDDALDSVGLIPVNLAPLEGLAAPLQPIATLQLDRDSADVDRLMDIISIAQSSTDDRSDVMESEPSVTIEDKWNAEIQDSPWSEPTINADPESLIGGIDGNEAIASNDDQTDPPAVVADHRESSQDDDFLRQQLVTELHDEVIDEQLFGSGVPPLPDNILPLSEPLGTVPRTEPSISFTIEPSHQDSEAWDSEAWDKSDRPVSSHPEENAPANWDDAPNQADSDFYASFAAEPSPSIADEDTIHRLTDLTHQTSTEPDPAFEDASDEDIMSMFTEDAFATEMPSAAQSSDADLFTALGEAIAQDNPIPSFTDAEETDMGSDTANAVNDGVKADDDKLMGDRKGIEQELESFLSPDTSLAEQAGLETSTELFSDEASSMPFSSAVNDPEDLFKELSSDSPAEMENEFGGLTPVSSTLDDLFTNDSSSNEPPASAQSIAKPIDSSFAEALTESSSQVSEEALFDRFTTEDSGVGLFEESLEPERLDSLQEDIGEQAEDAGFASLLEELQQDGSSQSGALSDAEEAKTLADLLRGQNAYLGQPPAEAEPDNSKAIPPSTPSDSAPFSNWFGDEDDTEGIGDAQKKNKE